MSPVSTTFPPGTPTTTPANRTITVDALLRNPLRITRRVNNLLNDRLLASRIFSDGEPAVGGAVIYDRVLASDLYTTRDVQEIEPGAEFPIVDDGEVLPEVAKVAKRGGMAPVTYEAKRRNSLAVVDRKLVRLTNTIARKIDTVAMAVLASDPIVAGNTVVGTSWSNTTTGDPVGDLARIKSTIDNQDLGYVADTVLVNPAQELSLFLRKDIRDALPKENTATNPLLSGKLNGLLNFSWYASNRVPVGEAYVFNAGILGSLHDEVPLYSRVVDQQLEETYYVMAARVTVPVITDPLAVRRVTGLA